MRPSRSFEVSKLLQPPEPASSRGNGGKQQAGFLKIMHDPCASPEAEVGAADFAVAAAAAAQAVRHAAADVAAVAGAVKTAGAAAGRG